MQTSTSAVALNTGNVAPIAKAPRKTRTSKGRSIVRSAPAPIVSSDAVRAEAAKKRILATFKPEVKTQAEADAAVIRALRSASKDRTELESGTVARLASALADDAFFLLSTGKIGANKMAATALIKHVREIATETVIDAKATETREVDGKTVDSVVSLQRRTLFDAAGPTVRVAAQAAMLIALHDTTRVAFGFVPSMPISIPVTMVWADKPAGKRDAMAVCLPWSAMRPQAFAGVSADKDASGRFPGVFAQVNTDTSLRALDNGQIALLYAAHFAGDPLLFETSVEDERLRPTGILLSRKPPVARVPGASTGTSKAPEVAVAGIDPKALHNLALIFRDKDQKEWAGNADIREWLLVAGEVYACLLHKACLLGVVPSKSYASSKAAGIEADILRCAMEHMAVPGAGEKDDGNAFILRGTERYRVTTEDSVIPTVTPPKVVKREPAAA